MRRHGPVIVHCTNLEDFAFAFALLTFMGKEKNARKNKINNDLNPTTNPNPKPTIDKAVK